MVSRSRCPACGSDTSSAGPCAACLLGDLFDEPPPAPQRPDAAPSTPARRLGDYELIRPLGRGAGGIVHLARQTSLNRLVALKLLHPGRTHQPEVVARFRAEAVATARLQHPNIVAIHEIGEADGVVFYSMDHVDGSTLADLVRSGPIPVEEAIRLVHCLADAVEHAHAQGVLHRDLKPANILVDRLGNPRIADFGLAKLLDGDSNLTSHGDILGSPSFMSPEQAEGGAAGADVTSDVYALGAILYYLLTARPPFVGDSVAATLRLVREGRLVQPRSLNPGIPVPLEQICLKALARDRSARFPTAGAMEEALRSLRFSAPRANPDRPARSRVLPSGWSPARLLARVAVGATLVLLAVTAVFASLRQREHTDQQKALGRYAETIRIAHREITQGHPATARRHLEEWKAAAAPGETAGFEWHHLHHETRPFENRILLQRPIPIDALTLDPNRGQLAFILGPHLGWMDTWTSEEADLTLAEPLAGARLGFSPDSMWLAVAGPQGTRFEVSLAARKFGSDSKLAFKLSGLPAASLASWSPDGKLLALSHRDCGPEEYRNKVSIWDVATGKRLPESHHDAALAVHWSADSHILHLVDTWGHLVHWAVRSPAPLQNDLIVDGPVGAVFSPDGRYVATVDTIGRLRLNEVDGGKRVALAAGLSRSTPQLMFSPDGRRLASTGAVNHGVLLWDVPTLTPRGECQGHTDLVTGMAFTHLGNTLITSSRDGSLRLWNLNRAASYPFVSCYLQENRPGDTLFSPDGLRVAVTTLNVESQLECQILRLSDYEAPGPVLPFLPVAWSPDSRQLLGSSLNGRLVLWDVNLRRELASFPSMTPGSVRSQLSPDGRWLASLTDEGHVHLVHVPTSQSRRWPSPSIRQYAFSPDSRRLALSGPDGPVLWEFEEGRQRTLPGVIGAAIGFSPDGASLAVEGERGTVRLLDTATGKRRLEISRHEGRVTTLAFSPDGRTLVTGGEDRQIRLWLTSTGELLTSSARIEPPLSTVFSPDGRWLMVGSRHGQEILAAPGHSLAVARPATPPESFWTQALDTAARFRTTDRFSRGHNINPWE